MAETNDPQKETVLVLLKNLKDMQEAANQIAEALAILSGERMAGRSQE